ncbi:MULTISPECIES: HD family phosphohydrolase [unclassified Moorena]|uniref:HD family phosphohydrolase n=1 Tax=unclassified Moorena TaxID=2683338 RepID=UPI0025E7E7A5|nr:MULTISPECIES: HD family phosphohydrolase [unclassified Moorena]
MGFNSSSAAKSSVSQSQQENLKGQPLQLTESPTHCEGTSTSLTSGKDWGKSQHQLQQKITLPVMWTLAVVSLTSVMGGRFYNQPQLDVETVAPQTVRAPFDALVEDSKTTAERRKEAQRGAQPVLMIDQSVTERIDQNLEKSLDAVEELRTNSGVFPFVKTDVLSIATQRYLRQSKEWEWRAILAFSDIDNHVKGFDAEAKPPTPAENSLNKAFVEAVSELQSYRQQSSEQEFSALIESISAARQQYAQVLPQLSQYLSPEFSSLDDVSVLDLSDQDWQKTRIVIKQAAGRILTQGMVPGLPPNLIQEAVKVNLSSLMPQEAQPLAKYLLVRVLEPNLIENKELTKLIAEQAAEKVEPMMVSVQQGDVIVTAGETITQTDFVLLDYFDLSRRGINWPGLMGFGGLVTTTVGIFALVQRRVHPKWRRRDYILVLLLTLSMPISILFKSPFFKIPYTMPAIGLLVGNFYGSTMGVTVVVLLTGLVTFSMEVTGEQVLANVAGGLLGALMAGRMRSREELAVLGVGVGLTQGVVSLIINLIISATASTIWYAVLPGALLFALSGLAWSIVALGLSPYLERLFDLVTPIRLAELSNPNRPLLKRLATEAPGTFQHTLFVASLAEAAAQELHCNVELVRAGTLYHDIGKMHDPLGFIENQMGGPNKHDQINDPFKSAEIIKKHVTEGLVMARKHQLPEAVRDFIPEHQGKLLISYFYFQAQQKAQLEGTGSVDESYFRYDGPIPQSQETGVVMLADACEAALRSLKEVTPETALTVVNKILKARWQDNQLVDSGLTRQDLSKIAQVFIRVWQQYNHQRIAYPKGALNCQSSPK